VTAVNRRGEKVFLPRIRLTWGELVERIRDERPGQLKWMAAYSLHAHGWSLAQIAVAFGCDKSTVSRRLRALERRLIAEYGITPPTQKT